MRLDSSSDPWRDDPAEGDCERVALLISRQIDGELAPQDARELRLHLAVCSTCRYALDAQSNQSRMLSESLSALWKKDDCAARMKDELASRESLHGFNRRFSKTLACGAVAAGLLFFAATVCAPSSNPTPDDVGAYGVPLGDERPVRAPAETPKAVAPVAEGAAPHAAPIETADSQDDLLEANEPDPVITLETVKEADLAPVSIPPVASVPETHVKPRVAPDIFGTLAASAPLKPLGGISLNYSGFTATGAPERGRVIVLGDVLNSKGVVRIETDRGEILEAAQSEIESVFAEPHRSAARRILIACADQKNKKWIEQAIQKAGE